MRSYAILFKYKTLIALLISISICATLILYFHLPLTIRVYGLVFVLYVVHFLSIYTLIVYLCEKHFVEDQEFYTEMMTLSSDITIGKKNQQKVACFILSNKSSKITLEVETKRGMLGEVYSEMNIDTIMIKPNKMYRVSIVCVKKVLDGKCIRELLAPVSIDYYDLQDKFYVFKITSKSQKGEQGRSRLL